MILAKLALGAMGTLAVTGMYVFHEGTIRVDVDEHHEGGSHVHVWAPAAMAPMATHFIPQAKLEEALRNKQEWMPVARAIAKNVQNYPNVTFVDVQDGEEHVTVSTRDGKLQIVVKNPDEDVHVAVPLSTIEQVVNNIDSRTDTL